MLDQDTIKTTTEMLLPLLAAVCPVPGSCWQRAMASFREKTCPTSLRPLGSKVDRPRHLGRLVLMVRSFGMVECAVLPNLARDLGFR